MKLSLRWLFDHIVGNWQQHSVDKLIELFNRTTAEIEAVEKVSVDLNNFTLVTIVAHTDDTTVCFSPEDKKEYKLSPRNDLQKDDYALIWRKKDDVRWAFLADMGSGKEALFPALHISEKDLAGGWKKSIETEDYILHLDNKSVTHRPDMWGHRGVAREIAALLKLPLKSESEFIRCLSVKECDKGVKATKEQPFSLVVEDSKLCKRFAAYSIPQIQYTASLPWMAIRLARVDSRPINAIVDATNYVMLDIAQPMHAFDAAKLSEKNSFGPRRAKAGEKLTLLDGQTITLTPEDIVIANGQPVGLAGVMGGASSAVSATTNSLLIEAGCFDASLVRKSALNHKHRTEASARFEKSLDPHNVPVALMRFLKLLDDAHIAYSAHGDVPIIGSCPAQQTVTITQAFIEVRLGMPLEQKKVIALLEPLGFTASVNNGTYTVGVPTWRSSKEQLLPEDILEEIARFNGYDVIPLDLPGLARKPFSLMSVLNERAVKQYMAYSTRAQEVYNYALFDEEFLTTLSWQPQQTASLQNPISAVYTRLVTSLVPHLFKNLVANSSTQERMRLFELNRVWSLKNKGVQEQPSLASVWYDKHVTINFYELKDAVEQLFATMRMNVTWKKAENTTCPSWFDPYTTAQLLVNDTFVGHVGLANPAWIERTVGGSVGIIELNADLFLTTQRETVKFVPLPKYPSTSFDISLLVPLSVTVSDIERALRTADKRIYSVLLIDSFQKAEWKDKKSLTFRMIARDPEKTFVKEEIDHINNHVKIAVERLGAVVR